MTIRAIILEIGGVLEITPDPHIFQLTCERLGLPPHETLFLDDHEPNIARASEFGLQTILFRETGQAIATIRALLQGA